MSTNYQVTTALPPTVGSGAVGPYLIPPSGAQGVSTQPLVIWVTQVCAANVTTSTPGITTTAPAPTQPDFALSFQTAQGAGGPPMFAVVTVQPTNLYTDSRAALQASFTAFRQQVESLELQSTPALIPGGARLLLARVAAALPLRYDEILFYAYGLDPARQCIDLQPGMQLRVENGGYQYVDGPGGAGYGLNAYVSQGVNRFAVAQQPDGLLAFDSFTARFAPGYTLNPAPGCPMAAVNNDAAAGLLDLQLAANARRHLRLIYPSVFNASGSVDNVGTSSQTSAILLGADTYADIEAATGDVIDGNYGCGKAAAGDNPIVSIQFAGRTVAVPEIMVLLRNQPAWLPVGATLRNVVQQVADPAPGQMFDSSGTISFFGAKVWRWFQPTAAATPMGSTNVYGQAGFSFSQTALIGPYGDQWDLPLLKGDSVWWLSPTPAGY